MSIKPIIQLARPGHWTKNVVVLMPVVFGLQIREAVAWGYALAAAAAFCFASSFAYIINDITDCQSDKSHPVKKNRPLAAGRISIKAAVAEALIFLLLAVAVAQSISFVVLLIILAYLLLQILYTTFLKTKMLLDVICIAMGFVLRAASGAAAIGVEISPWLFICTFTICLFMGFCKRYSEVVTIPDKSQAKEHRHTLIAYSPQLLTHLITLSAGIAVIAFLLYGLSERTVAQFGTNYFIYTLPLVVYAVFRFVMLSMNGSYADPTDLILHDRPFQLVTTIWVIAAFVIVYWGRNLQSLIQHLY